MYVRPQGYRYTNEIRLPENYSGNTFREPPLLIKDPEEPTDPQTIEEPKALPEIADKSDNDEKILPVSSTVRKSPFGSLFGLKGGIGTEELLILALVLLLSDGESNDDLILFLALLLFVK